MKYWLDNSAVWTHYGNASSIIFPAWEKAFAVVINHHLPNVKDQNLKSRMIQFVKEELSHANAHESFNKRHNLKDAELKEFSNTKVIHRRPGMIFWLGTMVSIEHLACCMSRGYLDKWKNHTNKDYKLFAWHSKEELEHKTLALDLWDYLGIPRSKLIKIAMLNQKYVLGYLFKYIFAKLKQEKMLYKISTWKDLYCFSWYMLSKILVPMLRIYLPKFNPNKIDDTKYLRTA